MGRIDLLGPRNSLIMPSTSGYMFYIGGVRVGCWKGTSLVALNEGRTLSRQYTGVQELGIGGARKWGVRSLTSLCGGRVTALRRQAHSTLTHFGLSTLLVRSNRLFGIFLSSRPCPFGIGPRFGT